MMDEVPQTWKDAMDYITKYAENKDTLKVFVALMWAAATTYILFYTDTPEALAASLGDLPGQVLDAVPFSG